MLRSLHRDFECVTIPYWNYFHHYDQLLEDPTQTPYQLASIMRDMPHGDASRADWSTLQSFPSSTGLPVLEEALNVDNFEDASTNIEQSFHSKYFQSRQEDVD